jgi:trk system potassium uptake protein
MNLVVVGGGEIGAQIAESLHRSHNVTVLDIDESRAEAFEQLDVRFMRGNGADPDDLRAAAADKAEAFVACTRNDDINVLACLAAKGLGAKETMAFVTRQRYVDAFKQRGAMESIGLSIDRILWPQRTLARQIVEIVRVPRALDTASFAGGRIKMVEYRLRDGDPYLGATLTEAPLPGVPWSWGWCATTCSPSRAAARCCATATRWCSWAPTTPCGASRGSSRRSAAGSGSP